MSETTEARAPESGGEPLLSHDYDGIREYDNPLPGWWTLIFWVTIVWSVLYAFNIGIHANRGRIASYEQEMAAAKARAEQTQAAQPPALKLDDAAFLALSKDPAELAEGKKLFEQSCVPCHKADGGGSIGPNLTDEYWIHGGTPTQIHATIDAGVLDKGMPAWGQVLQPAQVNAVSAYVISLQGTNPPDAKAPQGTKVEEAAEKSE